MKTEARVPPGNKQTHAEGTPAPGALPGRRGAERIPFRQQLAQPSLEYRSAIGRWLRSGESVDDHADRPPARRPAVHRPSGQPVTAAGRIHYFSPTEEGCEMASIFARSPDKIHAPGCLKCVPAALCCFTVLIGLWQIASAQTPQKVVDIATRPGVTQRFVYLSPENPIASVILFAGGHGGLQIFPNGSFKWGEYNFLVRTRQLFAKHGLSVAVVDAPSDRQSAPFLGGFRQTGEHVADIKVVIAWLKQKVNVPVWLVGTSMGTLSAAFIATQVGPSNGGPDGLVLTSTIVSLDRGRPVPEMPLQNITIPVLVVHHENDGCKLCAYAQIPSLMQKLSSTPKKELLTFKGGVTRGDPCEALAYHGFNGLENDVVARIAEWIRAK